MLIACFCSEKNVVGVGMMASNSDDVESVRVRIIAVLSGRSTVALRPREMAIGSACRCHWVRSDQCMLVPLGIDCSNFSLDFFSTNSVNRSACMS